MAEQQRWLKIYHVLTWVALIVGVCVVVLGAYVRLTDAGLGCPDWPGCYGQLTAPSTDAQVLEAYDAYPDLVIDSGKAWREMLHRYVAGALGLFIFALAIMSLFTGARVWSIAPVAWLLVAVVGVQAWLGMLTVTWQLQPLIVVAHLIGGFSIIGLLRWLNLSASPRLSRPSYVHRPLKVYAVIVLLALLIQVALGGWVSTNYAALACPDFPTCQNSWWPAADYERGFDLTHGLADVGVQNFEGGLLSHPARVAIHWVHRVSALVVSFLIICLVVLTFKQQQLPQLRRMSVTLLVLLIAHIGVAIFMVVKLIPLHAAVAHNALAALLWLSLISYLFVASVRGE